MSELKLGFVVNTKYGKEGILAHRIHLLIVRIILYYCYTHKNIQWGYHLFRSGRVNISYKKISLQNIALKPVQKLLSDLLRSVSDPRGPNITKSSKSHQHSHVTPGERDDHVNGDVAPGNGEDLDDEAKREKCLVTRSWEEVLTMVASDFSWDDDSENILFVLSSTLLGESDRIRSILANLKKEKKVNLVMIDIGALEGSSFTPLDRAVLNQVIHGKYSKHDTCLIPTEFLCSDLSPFWFKQIFKAHLTQRHTTPAIPVKFIGTETIVILDDSTGDDTVVEDSGMLFHLHPLDEEVPCDGVEIISLKFRMEVSYSTTDRCLDHKNCHLVLFDEKFCNNFTTRDHPSFEVEALEVGEDRKRTSTHVIKHLTPNIGVMFRLQELCTPSDLVSSARVGEEEEEAFDLLSFHDLMLDEEQGSFAEVIRNFLMRNNRSEIDDTNLLEQIKSFHDLHINDVPAPFLPAALDTDSNDLSEVATTLPAVAAAECAADEAMLQGSPRYYQRGTIAALVRKHQNDVKEELMSVGKLKEKHPDNKDKLLKEHKIQVVLHLVWYCEFSDMDPDDKELAKSGVLSLLRSLSFLTAPNHMFTFLTDQVVEEFHTDCQELLRELYEDGFLMEVPDILCDDSNSVSLSSSILSVHAVAPLYCEDTSSQSSELPTTSQSIFSRQRSWIDPCQLSQSGFSITVPKCKKKKKKKQREIGGKVGEDRNRIAAQVCGKKQSGVEHGRSSYLSCDVTPDEAKQSSKRRKLTRKNSVLDTPLKKQVKNPTTAKTSRARQRVEVTPQKTTPVSQIQESPVRATLSRASSFFGSQAQPPAMRSFVIKDGFKTPTRPATLTTPSSSTEDIPSLFRSPDQDSQHFTPPPDQSNSQCSSSQYSSQHSFTPPGTPRSGRKFVKKLSYNSPMRALFVTGSSNILPKRAPLDSDYIQMKASPSRSLLDKENEPFFPTLKYFGDPSERKLPKISDAIANTLEPIFNEDTQMIFNPPVNEDTQMPAFESSPYQGTLNLQSKGSFLKLLEESSSASYGIEKIRDSDNESDVSAASSVSGYRSILKSPFTKGRRTKKRTVSFSLDAPPTESDNESETGNFFSLLHLVDGSIRKDEKDMVIGCDSLTGETGTSLQTDEETGTSLQTDQERLDNPLNEESQNALLEESRKRKREEPHEK